MELEFCCKQRRGDVRAKQQFFFRGVFFALLFGQAKSKIGNEDLFLNENLHLIICLFSKKSLYNFFSFFLEKKETKKIAAYVALQEAFAVQKMGRKPKWDLWLWHFIACWFSPAHASADFLRRFYCANPLMPHLVKIIFF
ncbi:MAG: hypothetical protein NT084_14900 [Bacteroidetes bacterium]|nr:hypothetical protein [Bacteroidota bacterium]